MTKKNVLLVEYDEATINSIKEILPPHAFEIFVASDGEMAKRLLPTRRFDLMITAAMLPRFHGFNLAQAVAQEYPEIRIIVISAIYKGLEYKHQAVTTYRASDFFEKPLEKDKFRQRVLELLGMNTADLVPHSEPALTRMPVFDTAKMPSMKKMSDEESRLSSDDIFGDIIKKIDKVPTFEIKLDDAPVPAAPPKPSPAPQKADPGHTRVADNRSVQERMNDLKRAPAAPSPAPSQAARPIDLSDLRPEKKPVPPAGDDRKLKKIEDDIAKKFEETLSGLGIKKTAPSRPEAAHAPVATPRAAPTVAPQPPAPPKAPPHGPGATVVMPQQPPAPPRAAPHAPAQTVVPPHAPGATVVMPQQPPAPPKAAPAAASGHTPAPTMTPPPAAPKPPAAARDMRTELLPPSPPPPAAEASNEVGDYVLLGMIARGGMAEVYKAKKKGVKGFEKVIAIKKILSGYGEDDKYVEMLVDEAKIAAELSHPNIIQIYDLGKKDNYYFIAMEYVLGKDLREILRRLGERSQRMPEELALYVIIRVLEALNYAHKAKDTRGRHLEIVHRDVSPPNVLLSYNGDVKLTDFGVSKASIKIHQTLSGALKGKLLYMSPEQARGEAIDSRSDVYSAGVVLFEMLTGRKLFMDDSEMSVLKKVQNGEVIRPREANPAIDAELEQIILKALALEPGKRYPTAGAMITELEAYIMKKYDFIPGPIHFTHFIYGLFEADIIREGVKVDLKPIPEPVKLRKPAAEKPIAPPPPPPPPPRYLDEVEKAERPIEISLEPAESTAPEGQPAVPHHPPPPSKRDLPVREGIFSAAVEEEKKKSFLLPALLAVLIVAGGVFVYFRFIRPAPAPAVTQEPVRQPESKPAKTPDGGQAAPGTSQPGSQPAAGQPETKAGLVPAAPDAKAIEAEKLKQQTEEQRKLQEAEARRKQQEEQRRRQAELDKQKADEEAARLKAEEEARLKAEEEASRKAADESRLKAEEEARRKAEEERKRLEAARVKEGSVVSLTDVSTPPEAISQPSPVIPKDLLKAIPTGTRTNISFLIDHNGAVEIVRLVPKTSNEQVNDILVSTIKSWKFKPATKDGVRVKVWKSVPISLSK